MGGGLGCGCPGRGHGNPPASSCSLDSKYEGLRARYSLRRFWTRTWACWEEDLGGRGRGREKGSESRVGGCGGGGELKCGAILGEGGARREVLGVGAGADVVLGGFLEGI